MRNTLAPFGSVQYQIISKKFCGPSFAFVCLVGVPGVRGAHWALRAGPRFLERPTLLTPVHPLSPWGHPNMTRVDVLNTCPLWAGGRGAPGTQVPPGSPSVSICGTFLTHVFEGCGPSCPRANPCQCTCIGLSFVPFSLLHSGVTSRGPRGSCLRTCFRRAHRETPARVPVSRGCRAGGPRSQWLWTADIDSLPAAEATGQVLSVPPRESPASPLPQLLWLWAVPGTSLACGCVSARPCLLPSRRWIRSSPYKDGCRWFRARLFQETLFLGSLPLLYSRPHSEALGGHTIQPTVVSDPGNTGATVSGRSWVAADLGLRERLSKADVTGGSERRGAPPWGAGWEWGGPAGKGK